ncbi:MAG: hypothetical protein KTR31_41975 [Myxococcales bacterium]|nr:hypothetical protein [Myxococcales bacterium]
MIALTLLSACIFVVPGPDPAPETCDTLVADYEAELAAVQTCDEDADCGQVLANTSCGCTRDLVANLDADTTELNELRDAAVAQDCAVGGTSVCDCPEAAGFRCDAGACAWNYLASYEFLPVCEAANGDPMEIGSVTVEGDELVVEVSFSGGCNEHDVVLCWPDQSFMESFPVQVQLELFHEDNGDKCDAYLTEDRRLSLLPLAEAHEDAYGPGPATITINLDGQSVDYVIE